MTDYSRLSDHQKFEELAALAQSGALTASEWTELKSHLEICKGCREVYGEYQILAREGMPVLAARYSCVDDRDLWQDIPSPTKVLARIQATAQGTARNSARRPPIWIFTHPIARAALAACLVIVVGIASYHLGSRMPSRVNALRTAAETSTQNLALSKRESDLARPDATTANVEELQREIVQQGHTLIGLREAMNAVKGHENELIVAKSETDEQLQSVLKERNTLTSQLQDAEQLYQTALSELASVRNGRDKAISQAASDETRIADLSAANLDYERRLKSDQQYLASDRDIRELMGARNLYIADVFDVDSNSRTRKPYGRVFYTQGRSLIFYAFDLDRQPDVKDANAFQAWGRRESGQAKPFNLGLLYMDNESNRRWVLRFDNPGELAEIDAVFVTIEPHGGSPKPTGKPFLYASLRKEVNHP